MEEMLEAREVMEIVVEQMVSEVRLDLEQRVVLEEQDQITVQVPVVVAAAVVRMEQPL